MITQKHGKTARNSSKKYILSGNDTTMQKGQTQESINNVMAKELNVNLDTMEAKATLEKKEQQEHIQQVTNHNATLVTMVQEKQRKIEKLMTTSKNLFEK